jgi:hypothetical protein
MDKSLLVLLILGSAVFLLGSNKPIVKVYPHSIFGDVVHPGWAAEERQAVSKVPAQRY